MFNVSYEPIEVLGFFFEKSAEILENHCTSAYSLPKEFAYYARAYFPYFLGNYTHTLDEESGNYPPTVDEKSAKKRGVPPPHSREIFPRNIFCSY